MENKIIFFFSVAGHTNFKSAQKVDCEKSVDKSPHGVTVSQMLFNLAVPVGLTRILEQTKNCEVIEPSVFKIGRMTASSEVAK